MNDLVLEQEIELTPDKLEDYLAAAASVAEELRDFLSRHYADLTTPAMTMRSPRSGRRNASGRPGPTIRRKYSSAKGGVRKFRQRHAGPLLITDNDMRAFAEYLVRLCESELSAGSPLAHGDNNHRCNNNTDRRRDRGMRRHENAAHNQGDDHAER